MEQKAATITEYATSTAEEFWDYISPQRDVFGCKEGLIYRGQANADWKLEPSILRTKSHGIYQFPGLSGLDSSEISVFCEVYALSEFAKQCDSSGLRIPGDSPEFRRDYLNHFEVAKKVISGERFWASEEYSEIMALAQHHGLPTRLLDWSYRSYVAAYFAASDAIRICNSTPEQRLAVWVMLPGEEINAIGIIRVPGNNNANIANQSGLFTLLKQRCYPEQPKAGDNCLDDYIARTLVDHLAKITLPISESAKVLDLCRRYGVTAATLFPDYSGAVRATLEHFVRWSKTQCEDGRDIQAQALPELIKARSN